MRKIRLSRRFFNRIKNKTNMTEQDYIEFIKKFFKVRNEDIEWVENELEWTE